MFQIESGLFQLFPDGERRLGLRGPKRAVPVLQRIFGGAVRFSGQRERQWPFDGECAFADLGNFKRASGLLFGEIPQPGQKIAAGNCFAVRPGAELNDRQFIRMSLKLRFTIILRIDLLRFKLEGPDEVFQKKVDLCRRTGSQIQHVIVRVDHSRNGGERRRNRHQILFDHLFLDLLFLFRRHAVTLVGAHPDQLFTLTPRFEHGGRHFPLRFPQADVNQIVPQNRLRLDFRVQQTPA